MLSFIQIWKKKVHASSACRFKICQAHVYLKLKCLSTPELSTICS